MHSLCVLLKLIAEADGMMEHQGPWSEVVKAADQVRRELDAQKNCVCHAKSIAYCMQCGYGMSPEDRKAYGLQE